MNEEEHPRKRSKMNEIIRIYYHSKIGRVKVFTKQYPPISLLQKKFNDNNIENAVNICSKISNLSNNFIDVLSGDMMIFLIKIKGEEQEKVTYETLLRILLAFTKTERYWHTTYKNKIYTLENRIYSLEKDVSYYKRECNKRQTFGNGRYIQKRESPNRNHNVNNYGRNEREYNNDGMYDYRERKYKSDKIIENKKIEFISDNGNSIFLYPNDVEMLAGKKRKRL